ncbi:DMT family transporter [Burkholderiaceae bacterium DAT-1]|nr:DMT family transporter [Burkholderiaceae bacterium DAT-1]
MSLVGSYTALSKPLVAAIPVFLLGWMRFGVGALAMRTWLSKPADEPVMTPRVRGLVFLESFLGNFLFSVCMLYGVSMTSAVSAGVIMAAIPAVVALLSWVCLKERISLRVWLAIACAAGGMGMLALTDHGKVGSPQGNHVWLGNLLVLGAVICEASYAVIGKMLTGALSPKRITSLINIWGLLLMTPLGIYQALQFNFAQVSPTIWGLFLFYALAASVWTVWLWMTGLRGVPASQGGVFTAMLPISAAAVGVLVLGESMQLMQLLALVIALIGVVLATLPQDNTGSAD